MRYLFLSFCLLAALTACESEHISMNTIINEDGTCAREIRFKTDSATLAQGHMGEESNIMGILDDDRWLYEIYDTTWVWAQRDFVSLDEMTQSVPLQIAGKQIRSTATLEKRFRWFYTDYVYTETFESIAPLFKVPLSKYMNDETAAYWLTGSPDILKGYSGMERKDYLDKMEDQFTHFVNANLINDVMDVLALHYDSIPNPPVDKETFLARKDTLIELSERGTKGTADFDVEKMLNEFFGTNTYTQVLKEHPIISPAWEQRQAVYVSALMLDVDYQLTLPGGIIEINECGEGTFRDGELHYRLSGMRLLAPHYTIRCVSSGKNNWALFVSFAIGIFALVLCGMGLWHVFTRSKDGTPKKLEEN